MAIQTYNENRSVIDITSRTLNGVLASAIVFVLTIAPFLVAYRFGLVNFDDYLYVEQIPQGPMAWFTDMSKAIWMPLTWASYSLDRYLFGDSYGIWHLVSILIHGANAVLLLRLFCKLWQLRVGSRSLEMSVLCCILTLIWSIHPLRVESVVALSSRKDVLSLFFELIAFNAWVCARKHMTIISYLALVAGSMCKPTVMTFPILCLVIDALILRRLDLKRYLFPAGYSLALAAFASIQQSAGGATVDMFHEGLLPRLIDSSSAFGIYIRNLVWPEWLAPQCIKKFPLFPRLMKWGLLATSAYVLVIMRRSIPFVKDACRQLALRKFVWTFEHEDLILAGLAWFAFSIAPMLGIAGFGYHAFADRFTYIPSIGLGFIILAFYEKICDVNIRNVVLFILSVCVIGLGTRTCRQAEYWENDERLFTHTLEVDGDPNAVAHASLGAYYFEFPHDLSKCIDHFEKAVDQDIRFTIIAFNLYVFALCELDKTNDINQLMDQFSEIWLATTGKNPALPLNSRFADIYKSCQIARLTATDGDVDEAERLLNAWIGHGTHKGPVISYLRMRIAKRRHDEQAFNAALKDLAERRDTSGYLKFRYLKSQENDIIQP